MIINKNKEDRGSIRKENGIDNLPAEIQLNKSMVCSFWTLPFNSKNIPRAIAKAPNTAPLPIVPTIPFDNFFPNNPMIINPISGRSGTNQTNFIILYLLFFLYLIKQTVVNYHFNLFNVLISDDFVFRYTIIRIASPTATSAAATAIIKNTNTCPLLSDK